MRRLSLILLLISFAAYSAGDSLEVAVLPAPLHSLTWHARLKSSTSKPLKFSVYWNYESDSLHRRADIVARPASEADQTGRSACLYTILECRGGTDSIIAAGEEFFTHATGANSGVSVLINAENSSAELAIGSKNTEIFVPLPFDTADPSAIAIRYNKGTKITDRQLITRGAIPHRLCSFASIDSLEAYLQASKDPYEGFWRYLDRDIDTEKTDIGAEYRLATVAAGNGEYEIIFLGGDYALPSDWKPLEIKGRLSPSGFADHFDLIWYNADGTESSRDTSASYLTQNTILKLDFPLLHSSMRLRRERRSR